MQDEHPLRDDFWPSLAPGLSAINVPVGLGSFSDDNLRTHRGGKWAPFYSEAALAE